MYPKHLLKQQITIYSGRNEGDTGDVSYSAATQYPARIEQVNRIKGNQAGGDTVVVSAIIWVQPDATVEEQTRIDDIGDGSVYRVVSVNKVPDASGRVRLIELECAEWVG